MEHKHLEHRVTRADLPPHLCSTWNKSQPLCVQLTPAAMESSTLRFRSLVVPRGTRSILLVANRRCSTWNQRRIRIRVRVSLRRWKISVGNKIKTRDRVHCDILKMCYLIADVPTIFLEKVGMRVALRSRPGIRPNASSQRIFLRSTERLSNQVPKVRRYLIDLSVRWSCRQITPLENREE